MSKYTFSNWIETLGGPFILMEKNQAAYWQSIEGNPSHYDMVCESQNYTDSLVLDSIRVIIINDEGSLTSVVTVENTAYLISLVYLENTQDIIDNIEYIISRENPVVECIEVNFNSENIVLFDSAGYVNELEYVEFFIANGKYYISTYIHTNRAAKFEVLVRRIEQTNTI